MCEGWMIILLLKFVIFWCLFFCVNLFLNDWFMLFFCMINKVFCVLFGIFDKMKLKNERIEKLFLLDKNLKWERIGVMMKKWMLKMNLMLWMIWFVFKKSVIIIINLMMINVLIVVGVWDYFDMLYICLWILVIFVVKLEIDWVWLCKVFDIFEVGVKFFLFFVKVGEEVIEELKREDFVFIFLLNCLSIFECDFNFFEDKIFLCFLFDFFLLMILKMKIVKVFGISVL